ncbi:triose-phosphate isomerase [Gayadomonas joobiniege]|uniref:triose-phosphate isomerase n=1 Tax=Gayadomonas joobiniege TaxID=1234606 RepID=UPI000376BC74|nr:triose-phosphate isomerase [Gayadomonas joobiniege]
MKRKPIVAANWKMNGNRALVDKVLESIRITGVDKNVQVMLAPPATLLSYLAEQVKDLKLDVAVAAQNVNEMEKGALTGEISVAQVKEAGAQWVICGHSERRSIFAERSKKTAEKFVKVHQAGLTPVLCVGESVKEYKNGKTFSRLTSQIEAVFHRGGEAALKNSVIAYEPVWAVGTGKAARPEQAEEILLFIRNLVSSICPEVAASIRIIYGGSITPNNAADLFSQSNIDGGLIGGAGLEPEKFIKICQMA